MLRELIEACRATLGSRHPNTLASIGNLGTLLNDKGDLAAAEPLLREALEAGRATLGGRHPDVLRDIGNFADLLLEQGGADGAFATLDDAAEVACEVLGPQHLITLVIDAKAALIAYARGEGATALAAAVARMKAMLGAAHRVTTRYAAVLVELSVTWSLSK